MREREREATSINAQNLKYRYLGWNQQHMNIVKQTADWQHPWGFKLEREKRNLIKPYMKGTQLALIRKDVC